MRAGKLNRRISFEKQVMTPTEYGHEGAYIEIAKAWASIEPLRGRETMDAGVTSHDVTHRVRCRYRRDVSIGPEMRIRYGTRLFEIVFVIDVDEAHRELEIEARELIANQD